MLDHTLGAVAGRLETSFTPEPSKHINEMQRLRPSRGTASSVPFPAASISSALNCLHGQTLKGRALPDCSRTAVRQQSPLKPQSPDVLQGDPICVFPALSGWISCLIVGCLQFVLITSLPTTPYSQGYRLRRPWSELRVQVSLSLVRVPI